MNRWGPSADGYWHAIDELAQHPPEVFTAVCGQRLPRKTTALDEGFFGTACQACAEWQWAAALLAMPAPEAGRPPVKRSPRVVVGGGRPALLSTLRGRVRTLIRTAGRAVISFSLTDVRTLQTRPAAGLSPIPRACSPRPAGPPPEVTPAMPTRPRRSPSTPQRGADSTGLPLSEIPLLDADGVEIPLVGGRVEQIAIDEAYGALPARLHRHGDVRGRDHQRVYVRFDGEYHLSALHPRFVRLVAAPDGQRAR